MDPFLARYGPWALIAGASEGLGAAFARALAARGLSLVLVARRAGPLEELAASLRGPVEVRVAALDLGGADLVERIGALVDGLDVGLVVYNAAYSLVGPFLDQPLAEKERILDVNCRGPLILAHLFGERLRRRGRGGLLLMSSLSAFMGSPLLATYGASKAFGLSLGEALGHELAPSGVDVLVCCAGATVTPGFVRQTDGVRPPRAMRAEAVVDEALRALGRRRVLVPGRLNRLAAWLLARLMTRRAAVAVMGAELRRLPPTRTGGPSR